MGTAVLSDQLTLLKRMSLTVDHAPLKSKATACSVPGELSEKDTANGQITQALRLCHQVLKAEIQFIYL